MSQYHVTVTTQQRIPEPNTVEHDVRISFLVDYDDDDRGMFAPEPVVLALRKMADMLEARTSGPPITGHVEVLERPGC